MKIIDLSQEIYEGMPVYPGDPEIHIEQIHNLDKEGWRLRYLQFSTHIGTHADSFSHMDDGGETIDKLPIERFIGQTVLAAIDQDLPREIGLAFKAGKLDLSSLENLKSAKPKFVIVGDKAELDVELERSLLQSGILTITDLVNMSELPEDKPFMFYGVPLKIKDSDGSPIRAFAIID